MYEGCAMWQQVSPGELIKDQVERRRFLHGLGEQAVHLAAMVRLVIEDVRQCIAELLLDIGRPANGSIAHPTAEVVLAEPLHKSDDARVLGLSRRT